MNLIDKLKLEDTKVKEVTLKSVEMQIACMLLLHEACVMIKANRYQDGIEMMSALYLMRQTHTEQRELIIETFEEERVIKAYQQLEGDKILYSSVDDDVLRANSLFFAVPPRPAGGEYMCNPAVSRQKRQEALAKYFPAFRAA